MFYSLIKKELRGFYMDLNLFYGFCEIIGIRSYMAPILPHYPTTLTAEEKFTHDLNALFKKYAFTPPEIVNYDPKSQKISPEDMTYSIMRHKVDPNGMVYAIHIKGKSDSTIRIPTFFGELSHEKYAHLSELDRVIQLYCFKDRVVCRLGENVMFALNGCNDKGLALTPKYRDNPLYCNITIDDISKLMTGTHTHLQLANVKKESSWKRKGLFAVAILACGCALAYFKGLLSKK